MSGKEKMILKGVTTILIAVGTGIILGTTEILKALIQDDE